MSKRLCIIAFAFFSVTLAAEVHFAPSMLPLIFQDIYEDLVEQGQEVDFEELSQQLADLSEHPLNLNTATADDLHLLPFLTDQQIDAILLLVYQQPLHNLYELQLIDCLPDYQIRNLLPFVTAEPVDQQEPVYWREMWHYARHDLLLRLDARNIENTRTAKTNNNGNDPMYAYLKYNFNYRNRVQWGISMERDPGEPFYSPHKTYGADFYGGYLQLQNFGHLKRFVAGDFRASFGQGLVINTNMRYGGKLAMLQNGGFTREGLQRKTSTAEYNFLRGAGATISVGKFDLTAFYSARKIDANVDTAENTFPSIQKTGYHRTVNEINNKRSEWQQIIGFNGTLRLASARIGITVTEQIFTDTLIPKTTYYNHNYFRGKRQFAAGLNYQWHLRRVMLFGEVATAQNNTWGVANITGLRYSPINGIAFTALYRYYSPHFDNLLANAFGETSRQNDENGLMLGTDITAVQHWRFSIYGDAFHFHGPKYGIRDSLTWGGDALLQAEYLPSKYMNMQWKTRAKIKGGEQKYELRYNLNAAVGNWLFKTVLNGNVVLTKEKTGVKPHLGGVISQQVEYHFSRVPIVIQARGEAFYTANYDNRLYLYENDVLYAFSIPMLYGQGGRWFLNFRYKINEHLSLYLKTAQTIYAPKWAVQQNLYSRTRTEMHTLLRVKF